MLPAACQRKSAMTGLDQPVAARLDVDVTIKDQHSETSTDKLLRVIRELKEDGQRSKQTLAEQSLRLAGAQACVPPGDASPDPDSDEN